MNSSLSSSFRTILDHRMLVLAFLLASTVPACSDGDMCSDDSCSDPEATGGAKPSSGGAWSGGSKSTGGGGNLAGSPPTGGQGGAVVEPTGGSAGEATAAGGRTNANAGPRVTAVEVDGRAVELGGNLAGVHEGAQVKVTFNRPMDTLSVEKAFVARSDESSLSSFVVAWNEDNTELTLILRSRVKYEEVTSLEEPAPELGFLLTRTAEDEEGEALTEEFFVTFSLLRRLTQFIEPDLTNSVHAYGNVPYDYVQEVDGQPVPTQYISTIGPTGSNCPWLNPENDHDGYANTFRQQFPYTAARNFSAVPGRHSANPRGTRVAIYSFPLADVPTSGLESATLKLAKWERVRLDESDRDADGSTTDYVPYYSNSALALYELPFSVDALPSVALPVNQTSYEAQLVFGTSSWRANLLNTEGAEYSKGLGFFEFEVTELVEDGVDAGDTWGMFRADFDGLPVVQDDPITVCVTMGLEAVALVE